MAQEHQIRYRKPKNHTDLIQSTRSKPTISSLLSTVTPATDDSDTTAKKKYFTSTRFRGLGCTAPAQVSVPTMIRTSANWEGKKARKKKPKKNKNCVSSSDEVSGDGAGLVLSSTNISPPPAPAPAIASSSSCLVVPDVWCGPGIGLSTDAASVDCMVSRRVVSGRGKVDGQKINLRERGGRRMVHPEELPFFDGDSGIPHHRFDVFRSRHHRHLRHRSPEGLAEIVMLQGNLIMGGRLDHDRYRDWRLDVDAMSYELTMTDVNETKIAAFLFHLKKVEQSWTGIRITQKTRMPSSYPSSEIALESLPSPILSHELLELGDKIGYVSTGLREEEIGRCVRKTKPAVVCEGKASSHVPLEMQWKCTICQEEYEGEDEIGKLECGHFYHMYCIKQWLVQKKTCPICKVAVVQSRQ